MDQFWETLAQKDPLWAILSDPSKRGRKWRLDDFLETGRREITLLLHQLRRLNRLPQAGVALDFGCGVGRLTQALGESFQTAIGIDISPTMIRLAEAINANPRVRFLLNSSDSLAIVDSASVDLLYSDIVLQHVEPPLARRYVAEFVRVIKPGGVGVFQLPSHRRRADEMPRPPIRMDDEAYRASVTLSADIPASLEPSEIATCSVQVRNDSRAVWDQGRIGTLRVGNHWRDGAGAMIVQDDGRTALPAVVRPGEVARVQVDVRAPEEPGAYRCEFDVVHEGLTWFGDVASTPASIAISVSGSTASATEPSAAEPHNSPRTSLDIYRLLSGDQPDASVEFPMHGVPVADVHDLLRSSGAEVFHLEEDERGGPEWHGYRYFVSPRRR